MRPSGADDVNTLRQRHDVTDEEEFDATRWSIIDTIFDYIIRACDLVTLASTLRWHCDSTNDDFEVISRASEIAHAMADAMAAERSGEDSGAPACTPDPPAPAVDERMTDH